MLVTVDVEQIDRRILVIELEIEKLHSQIKNLSLENEELESLKTSIERFSVKDKDPNLQEGILQLLSIHKKLTTLEITEKLPGKNKPSIASTLSRLNTKGLIKKNGRLWLSNHFKEDPDNPLDSLLSINKNKNEA
jgi:hypothetical protein